MRIGAATSMVTDALCRNREKEDVIWMRCSSVGSRDGALDVMLKMYSIVKSKLKKRSAQVSISCGMKIRQYSCFKETQASYM